MRIRYPGAFLIGLALCILAMPASGQTRPDPCAVRPANPSDVSLQLSLTNARSTFQEGEMIGLALSFASSAAGKYSLNTRNYDRSGRLHAETFCIEPAAGRDPLDDYFNSGLSGFIGGGIGGYQPVSSTPLTVTIELNEWRLLPPGHYRLRLMSGRIERGTAAGEPGPGTVPVQLWSNTVEFVVTDAAPDWQAAQLAAATSALDSGRDDNEKRDGARRLRFLGSEAATRELANRFSGTDRQFSFEFMFGLIGSPFRQTAIEAMKAAIPDSSRAVTRDFVNTLALLELQANPVYQLPPYREQDKDAWGALQAKKLEAYRLAIANHLITTATAVTGKTGEARAITLDTLSSAPTGTRDRGQLRQMLVAGWEALPLHTRNELIQYRWSEIAGPEMLPILRRIVDTPLPRGRPNDQPNRGPALARLYELAPIEGRELMLREMLDPRGGVGISTLRRLPDRELPQIEQPILTKFRSGNGSEVDYQLLERYGTAASLAGLRQVYEPHRGRWACAPQTAMLRYFLRVDRDYGIAAVTDALSRRGVTGCYTAIFGDLDDALTIPEIERLAIAALDDASAEVARNAAEALGRYGSAGAEAPLWKRLEKFHEMWKGRYDALPRGPVADRQLAAEGMLEYALVRAIAGGESWLAGADALDRLTAVSSPPRRTEFTRHAAAWRHGALALTLTWFGDGRVAYSVATYSGDSVDRLAKKLRQFPAGTRIAWSLPRELADRHRADVDVVQEAARAAGILLEIR